MNFMLVLLWCISKALLVTVMLFIRITYSSFAYYNCFSLKATKEVLEKEQECKRITKSIEKMVQRVRTLEEQVQDIHEKHVQNTQVIDYSFSLSSSFLPFSAIYSICLLQFISWFFDYPCNVFFFW